MIQSSPNYIPIKYLCSLSSQYEWDDWDPYEVVGKINEELVEKLAMLSFRAVVTFAIGCSEWVIWRFRKKTDDPVPYQYLEACWVYNLTNEYKAPPILKDKDWKGPVRGAINLSLMTILNSIYNTEDECPEAEAAYADDVTLHILSNDPLYIEWRDKVLSRLNDLYPRQDKNPMGNPIPREVLDVDTEFNFDDSEILIHNFLSTVNILDNPFIRPYNK